MNLKLAMSSLKPQITMPTLGISQDQIHRNTHHHVVQTDDVQVRENNQCTLDTQHGHVDLAHLHTSIGHYGRMLWDIQQVRVSHNNRIKAMERDGLVDEYIVESAKVLADLEKAEHDAEMGLVRMVRRHPMRAWVEAAPGIGLGGFARILAVTGPLDRFPTVSKLWKYLGLAVVDNHRQRMVKGELASHTNCQGGHLRTCPPDCKRDHHPNCTTDGFGTAYAPKGLVVCHQLGESIVKVNKGKYREAYDRKKADYEQNRLDWPQAHRHAAAMRYAVKCLIRDLWVEWHHGCNDAQWKVVSFDP